MKYPKLIEKETNRRHESVNVRNALESNGFRLLSENQIWETRRTYHDVESLCQDLQERTGRSILHELTDRELKELVLYIKSKVDGTQLPIIEQDSWTVWFAAKIEPKRTGNHYDASLITKLEAGQILSD